MTSHGSWMRAEIAGPKKAVVINKTEVVTALLKRFRSPVLIIGSRSTEIELNGGKLISYLARIAEVWKIPVVTTNRSASLYFAEIRRHSFPIPVIEIANLLSDPGWKGISENGTPDLAIFSGLPYSMEWTLLSGLKHFAPHLKTLSLEYGYEPQADYSLPNIDMNKFHEILSFIGRGE